MAASLSIGWKNRQKYWINKRQYLSFDVLVYFLNHNQKRFVLMNKHQLKLQWPTIGNVKI